MWGISFAQVTGPTGPDTEYAPCLEGQMGARNYESPVLVSPDEQWRAYASVEAKPGKVGCSNVSTLQVQGPNDSTFQIVHTIKPDLQIQGNGLKLVSWSPQHHLLAIRVLYWQDGSDAGGYSLLVYDADRKRAIEPDLAKLFARRYLKKECAFDITNVLGFDSRNRVLFEANDKYDGTEDEPAPTTRCLSAPTVWVLDLEANQLELVKRSHDQ